jgi:hypothetical protein
VWSYAVGSGGVATSPTLSLDGNKVAFVETTGGQPHFHVLAWRGGDGVDAGNAQNPLSPARISGFTTFAPAEGSGTASDLAFGGGSDSLSSPYVDYVNDVAYVGDDEGNLVRIANVFCTMNPLCSTGTPPQPTLDSTWNGTGAVAVGVGSCSGTATSMLTGPVEDANTGNVYVGCADGKVYGFNSSGVPLSPPSFTVGDGSATGGVVDPPIVDGFGGFVYAFAGNSAAGAVVAVQAQTTDLSAVRSAALGQTAGVNAHDGTFNDAYYSSADSSSWLLYAQGYDSTGTRTYLYAVGFSASREMNASSLSTRFDLAAASECSPLTDFLNGIDQLFFGCVATNEVYSFNIDAFPTATSAIQTAIGGSSAIVVDNVSPLPQASSIYFSNLGSSDRLHCDAGGAGVCAVKLTQSGLD